MATPNPITFEDDASNRTLEVAHILFMDIVGYSRQPMTRQSELADELRELVSSTDAYQTARKADDLIALPTGDGMLVAFFSNLLAPVHCAIQLTENLKKSSQINLRIGIHSGPVQRVYDINNRLNVAGDGVNMAQRVMDCGDAGHILVTESMAKSMECLAAWKPYIHDIGNIPIKHDQMLHVYSLYAQGKFGNTATPMKALKFAAAKVSERTLRRADDKFSTNAHGARNALVILGWFAAVGVVGAVLLFQISPSFRDLWSKTFGQQTASKSTGGGNAAQKAPPSSNGTTSAATESGSSGSSDKPQKADRAKPSEGDSATVATVKLPRLSATFVDKDDTTATYEIVVTAPNDNAGERVVEVGYVDSSGQMQIVESITLNSGEDKRINSLRVPLGTTKVRAVCNEEQVEESLGS